MTIAVHIRRQVLAAVSANLTIMAFGWNCAWANANLLELQSPNTKLLSGPITKEQASLIVSLVCIGGLFGNVSSQLAIEKFGRRNLLLFTAVPTIVAWLMVIFAQDVNWLYLSRILFGVSGGAGIVTASIFSAEICTDDVRGLVGSLGFILYSLGAVTELCIAMYGDYRTQAVFGLSVPCLLLCSLLFFPETPVHLQNENRIEQAKKSSEFYKGTTKLPEAEKFIEKSESKQTENNLVWNDFFGKRASRKAITYSIVLVILQQFCGCYILLNYMTLYFEEAGSKLTPIQSSIVITMVQCVANILTTFLIEKLGRKILYIVSTVGTCLGLFILAMHRLHKDELPGTEWLPIYVFAFTIFVASVGLLSVTNIIFIDILPPKIRSVMMTFLFMNMWILGFLTSLAYPYLLNSIALHGCLMVFSGFCLLSAVFALFLIPETKGKSYEVIATFLEK